MIDIGRVRRFSRGLSCRLYLDFGTESVSNPVNENRSNDGRVVGGDDSTNVSTSVLGNGNTVTTTDFGAVGKAIELAKAGVETAAKTSQQIVAQQGDIYSGALSLVGKQQQQFTDTIKDIKTSDVRVMVVAGLAVVGVVAAKLIK
jgi:hypothetical protein